MNIIRKSAIALSLAAFLTASPVLAGTYIVTEQAIESSTRSVRLPRSINSSIFVKQCDDCEELTLRIKDSTRYEVNGVPLTYAELKSVTAKHNGSLVIFYDDQTNTVTRLVMKGNFPLDLTSRNLTDDRTDPAQASQ